MGCNCGGRKATPQRPWRAARASVPRNSTKPVESKGKYANYKGFCPKCGWVLQTKKTWNARSKKLYETKVCTNDRCKYKEPG